MRALVLLSLAVAVGTAWLIYPVILREVSSNYFVGRREFCAAHAKSYLPKTVLPGLSAWLYDKLPLPALQLLCTLLGVFEEAATPRHTNAALAMSFLPFACLPFMLMYSESLKSSNPLAPLWPALVGLVGQLVGISVAFPLLWLPLFFLRRDSSSPRNAFVSLPRLLIMGLVSFFLLANIVGMFFLRSLELRAWFIVLFQIAPLFPGLLAAFTPQTNLSASPAVRAAVYMFFGGVGALGHVIGLLALIDDPSAIGSLLRLLRADSLLGPEYVDYLLWIDFLSMLCSVAVFVLSEGGAVPALCFLVLGPVFSPGLVLAVILSQREYRPPSASSSLKQKTK